MCMTECSRAACPTRERALRRGTRSGATSRGRAGRPGTGCDGTSVRCDSIGVESEIARTEIQRARGSVTASARSADMRSSLTRCRCSSDRAAFDPPVHLQEPALESRPDFRAHPCRFSTSSIRHAHLPTGRSHRPHRPSGIPFRARHDYRPGRIASSGQCLGPRDDTRQRRTLKPCA